MTDQDLQQFVVDELSWEPSINSAHIGVTVHDGIVTLSGHVGNYFEKTVAERSASRVAGVKAIAEELVVQYAFSNEAEQTDEGIAKRVLNVLEWNVSVPNDKIKVKVEKGIVSLTGAVEWYYQKAAAESAIRKLHGVTNILNNLEVKPIAQASDVKGKIKAALDRNSEIESDKITVALNGATVTLGGKVDSYFERNLVQRTAWSAPGVGLVEDNMVIG
jgi:osmotically-inducible protein OsmY